uniref:Uncharacterized protein n=1 Tax=Anopheles merus TaxID=30066 RepID=A0A182UXS3_ANOME
MRQKPVPSAARRIEIGFGQFHRTAGPTLRERQLLWRQQGGTVPAAGGCARIRYFPAFLSNLADRTQRFRHLCERFSKLHVFGRRYTISDGLLAMLLLVLVLLLLRKLPSLHMPHAWNGGIQFVRCGIGLRRLILLPLRLLLLLVTVLQIQLTELLIDFIELLVNVARLGRILPRPVLSTDSSSAFSMTGS